MTHNFNCGCQHTHQSHRCSPTRARERPSRSKAPRLPALHIVVSALPSGVAQQSLTHLGGKVLVSAIVGRSPNLNSLCNYVPPVVLVVPQRHPTLCRKPQAQCKDDKAMSEVGGLKRSRHHIGSRHCSIVSVHAMTGLAEKLFARSLRLRWGSIGGRISQEHCHSIRHSPLSPIFGDDSFCDHSRSCAGVNHELPTKQTVSAAEQKGMDTYWKLKDAEPLVAP